ncbi:MAG: MFS transporter [Novosphingobium sp.]|nr:MFS transporter [Novosphingobium sp.]
MLPVSAGLGFATAVIHIYALGPYIGPISETFGWSRTQTTIGLTIATLVQAVFGIPIGLMVDRYGPRKFGVVGVLLIATAFGLLGTATGSDLNWYFLWCLIAVAAMPVHATIWTSAVATRFEASRGLAFAVTLCGASISAALFPVMATWLIGAYGWRVAAPVQAAIWVGIAFPLILIFFRGARDGGKRGGREQPGPVPDMQGTSLASGMRSSIYHRLLVASLFFTFTIIALVVHFIPILTDIGADPLGAAGMASLIGIFSIIGRLGTGFFLDRVSGSLVGAIAFMLPSISCILLLTVGETFMAQAIAAMLIGLTLGAETDVIAYLTSQHFGLKNFAAHYGGLLAAFSIGIAFGPLGASMAYDRYGGYDQFLLLTLFFMVISSIAVGSLPRPRFASGGPQS